eukprot:471717-Alexandrium_andersonii.AAC.1
MDRVLRERQRERGPRQPSAGGWRPRSLPRRKRPGGGENILTGPPSPPLSSRMAKNASSESGWWREGSRAPP